ncbi:unnamed protein product [Mytilus coruscus]|uniref:Uncharacterized protein n=1 Tax=Mytilus coruscus TaxID=42192 RepID=A0A6J8ABF5_MYTCO|nr:unnamed protein product [Mytilus coruscus]
MNPKRSMLKLKLSSKLNNMDTTNKSPLNNDDIQSAQEEMIRPSFSEPSSSESKSVEPSQTIAKTVEELRRLSNVKYNFNTIQEGLSLAKEARELPPYMRLELSFTRRILEHPSKEAVKDEIRVMNTELRKITLCKLSEMVAHNILEVSKELDMKMQELDEELLKLQRYSERRDFFKVVQELIEEYKEKLRRYKETIARKPIQSGFKPKDKFKRKF